MSIKLENGVYALNSNGLPKECDSLEETVQNAQMRIFMPQGSFVYGRNFGSKLHTLSPNDEHFSEQATAFANEALADMAGVNAVKAEIKNGVVKITLSLQNGGEKTVSQPMTVQ